MKPCPFIREVGYEEYRCRISRASVGPEECPKAMDCLPRRALRVALGQEEYIPAAVWEEVNALVNSLKKRGPVQLGEMGQIEETLTKPVASGTQAGTRVAIPLPAPAGKLVVKRAKRPEEVSDGVRPVPISESAAGGISGSLPAVLGTPTGGAGETAEKAKEVTMETESGNGAGDLRQRLLEVPLEEADELLELLIMRKRALGMMASAMSKMEAGLARTEAKIAHLQTVAEEKRAKLAAYRAGMFTEEELRSYGQQRRPPGSNDHGLANLAKGRARLAQQRAEKKAGGNGSGGAQLTPEERRQATTSHRSQGLTPEEKAAIWRKNAEKGRAAIRAKRAQKAAA